MDVLQNHNLLGFVSDPDDLQRTLQTCPTPKDKRKLSIIKMTSLHCVFWMLRVRVLQLYLQMVSVSVDVCVCVKRLYVPLFHSSWLLDGQKQPSQWGSAHLCRSLLECESCSAMTADYTQSAKHFKERFCLISNHTYTLHKNKIITKSAQNNDYQFIDFKDCHICLRMLKMYLIFSFMPTFQNYFNN